MHNWDICMLLCTARLLASSLQTHWQQQQLQSTCVSALQGTPGDPWQQQQHGFQIGVRVSHAPYSSPALHPKALAAAGFSRPGTCATSSSMLTGSGRCSTSRGRSRSPRRPGTAPAAAAAAAAEQGAIASSLYRVWVPELHPSVADSGLCSSRDAVLRFVAQAGRTYVVMPYTRCAAICLRKLRSFVVA